MPIVRSIEKVGDETVDIFVEVDNVPQGQDGDIWGVRRAGGVEKVVASAGEVFGSGLNLAKRCAAQVVTTIEGMDKDIRPKEFQVQLAIKLDSEVGAVLAKASAGAQLQVTMKWVREP
jgi:hypothetical protein